MIILDFIEVLQARLCEQEPLIQFVIGPRQIGKTTGVEQFLADWQHPSHYVLVEGELNPEAHWLRLQWQKAQSLGPQAVLVIDEIQKVHSWAETLKSLWDDSKKRKKPIKCVFLGSSSLNLNHGMSESLAGRYELIEVPHWDFFDSKRLISHLTFDQYLRCGGYPGAYRFLEEPQRFKTYIRESIVKNVLEKDILLNHSVKKPALFRQYTSLLASYPCQVVSYNKLLGQLQEGGNASLMKNYLQLLEAAFMFKGLQKYSSKAVLTRGSSPKVLPLCPAICEALSETEIDRGRLFEMVVGSKLSQFADGLYYWSEGGYEVDFVVQIDKKHFAVEVKSGRRKNSKSLDVLLKKHPELVPLTIDEDQFVALSQKKREFFI